MILKYSNCIIIEKYIYCFHNICIVFMTSI